MKKSALIANRCGFRCWALYAGSGLTTVLIWVVFLIFAGSQAKGSELQNVLTAAAQTEAGSKEWNMALSQYLTPVTNDWWQLNREGMAAVSNELCELRAMLLPRDAATDSTKAEAAFLKVEFDICNDYFKSTKIRSLVQIYDRLSRLTAIVMVMEAQDRTEHQALARCQRLNVFVKLHGVLAFMPEGNLAWKAVTVTSRQATNE